MKGIKTLLTAFFALIATCLYSQNVSITVSNLKVSPGSTASIPVTLQSDVSLDGFSFNVILPQGIEIQKNKRGGYLWEDGDLLFHDDSPFIKIASVSSDASNSDVNFTIVQEIDKPKGVLLNIPVTIGSLANGDFECSLSKVNLVQAKSDGKKVVKDAIVKFTITVSNSTAIKNVTVDKSAKKAGIYTISGQKLNKITESGVYIVDGKKVAVKK